MDISDLQNLTISELKMLRNECNKEIKLRSDQEAIETKRELFEGMEVKVNHPKVKGKILIVEKVKIKKANLKEKGNTNGQSWNVPISMIEII